MNYDTIISCDTVVEESPSSLFIYVTYKFFMMEFIFSSLNAERS